MIALAPLIGIAVLVGLTIFGVRMMSHHLRARREQRLVRAIEAAMHARDDERRAHELAWFDAYRHGQGMPDLAPHELYETAQEYDWDRARLTVLGYQVLESWRHEQDDGSIVYEVLYQGHLERLQQAARKLATF